jgi:hypothetical protein
MSRKTDDGRPSFIYLTDGTIRDWEDSLRWDLPAKLAETLKTPSVRTRPLIRKPFKGTEVRFRIYNISYGSLEFELLVEGAKKLRGMLDENLGGIRDFLEIYLPTSFSSTLNCSEGDFEFEIRETSPDASAKESRQSTDRLIWGLANGSLVGAALIVLYFVSNWQKSLDEQRSALEKKTEMLLTLQNTIVTQEMSRVVELQKIHSDYSSQILQTLMHTNAEIQKSPTLIQATNGVKTASAN